MARGNLFFCSRDIDEVNQGEDETDLYDQREYLAVEYVQTNIEDTSKGLIRWLIEAVRELGGETGIEENADGLRTGSQQLNGNYPRCLLRILPVGM